ncbi:MAG: hypothetical protein QOG28_4540 [Trebonia sp.]|nr:hypothetical protein [Trebonia sp.]
MHTNIADFVALDAVAVRASAELVARARPADMARPTPCADWTLHGLISHMAAQHYGFAAACSGDGDPARWRPRRLGSDPAADYRASAQTVLAAFSAAGVLDRQFPLPEFAAGAVFPARQAVSFHFVDYVVHSWDVAKALGLEVHFTPELVDAALPVAEAVPSGEARLAPGAAFSPAVAWQDGSPLDRIVTILGRSPDWKSPDCPGLRDVSTEEGEQGLVELGFGFQVGQVPGAIDGDQFRPLQAGDDLGCHRGVGPRVRCPGHDERGDVERRTRPAPGAGYSPATADASAVRRRRAARAGGPQLGLPPRRP